MRHFIKAAMSKVVRVVEATTDVVSHSSAPLLMLLDIHTAINFARK